jgi:hypothetical protein
MLMVKVISCPLSSVPVGGIRSNFVAKTEPAQR